MQQVIEKLYRAFPAYCPHHKNAAQVKDDSSGANGETKLSNVDVIHVYFCLEASYCHDFYYDHAA